MLLKPPLPSKESSNKKPFGSTGYLDDCKRKMGPEHRVGKEAVTGFNCSA